MPRKEDQRTIFAKISITSNRLPIIEGGKTRGNRWIHLSDSITSFPSGWIICPEHLATQVFPPRWSGHLTYRVWRRLIRYIAHRWESLVVAGSALRIVVVVDDAADIGGRWLQAGSKGSVEGRGEGEEAAYGRCLDWIKGALHRSKGLLIRSGKKQRVPRVA